MYVKPTYREKMHKLEVSERRQPAGYIWVVGRGWGQKTMKDFVFIYKDFEFFFFFLIKSYFPDMIDKDSN